MIASLLVLAGLALITTGATLYSVPLGCIVGGCCCVFVGAALAAAQNGPRA